MRTYEARFTTRDVEDLLAQHYQETVLTIYGPHRPESCLRRLILLRDRLRQEGFKASLVRDYDDVDDSGQPIGAREKSHMWIEKSDYNIFVHLADGQREGLALELEYAKDNDEAAAKSIVIVELTPDDYRDGVTEMLTENFNWREIRRSSFQYEDDDMLLEDVLTFMDLELMRKILY